MLSKDIIDRRLETGITYAEFSYMLIQGYDFLHMYRDMNCIMQVEGSDQWGNITTGIDLIRKIEGKEAYAFTMPLILDSTGKKFGKSEGNADHHYDQKETGSASSVQSGTLHNVSDIQRLSAFDTVNAFMFCPMVHECSLNILHSGDQKHISHK